MRLMAVIGLAVLLDWVFGDPYWLPHPVRGMGRWIRQLERWVIQWPCSVRLQGVFLWIGVVGATWGVGWLGIYGLRMLDSRLAFVGEVLLLYTTLAARCLDTESRKVMHSLQQGKLNEARRWLSFIVGRETDTLSESEVVRGAVETVAENTVDGVISPLFFACIGGAPLALAYKAINTLDSMVGYKNEQYRDLGWASARMDDWANWIPARLTGVLIPLVVFFYNGQLLNSWKILLRDCRSHASPNSGYPEAAVAGGLQIQLGGTNWYFGKRVEKPCIGDPIRPLESKMIGSAIHLMYGTEILAGIVMLLIRYLLT